MGVSGKNLYFHLVPCRCGFMQAWLKYKLFFQSFQPGHRLQICASRGMDTIIQGKRDYWMMLLLLSSTTRCNRAVAENFQNKSLNYSFEKNICFYATI